jgi:biopolymer transport protein ExbD
MHAKIMRRLKPTEVLLPITPMLDMSFQLLFFFICVYHPPSKLEAQFLLDLEPRKVKAPPSQGGQEGPNIDSSSKSDEEDPFKDSIKFGYDPEMIVLIHAARGEREGDADYIIKEIRIARVLPEAKKALPLKDPAKEPIVLPEDPAAAAAEPTPASEKEILAKLPDILREARDKIPVDAATPRVIIRAPREIRMHKIVRLMDECSKAGFGVSLKVLQQ